MEKQYLYYYPNISDIEKGPLISSGLDSKNYQSCDTSGFGSQGTSQQNSSKSNESDSYEPSLYRSIEHPTSNLDTLIHLLKGNIGTGILAMSDAFKNAGLIIGFLGTFLMGAICTHCMHMLVRCSRELCIRTKTPSMTFSEVAYCSFQTGPRFLQRYASVAGKTITLCLFVTQMGFCCVYFLFVALNVQEVLEFFHIRLRVQIILILLLLPMIPLNLVRNLKYLTPASLMASILTVIGLAITFFYILQNLPRTDSVRFVSDWSRLPLYFGTAIYAFEGIGIVLPLENNMKNPADLGGVTGVLNTGMTIVTCLYTSIGFFGYLKYGDSVRGSITLNLPQHEILSQLVRIMLALAVFLSYGLQFYVPVNIVAPTVRDYFETDRAKRLAETFLRIGLVFITFVLAIIIPNLGEVISLVGAASSSTIALIAPPIIEIVTFWPIGFGKYKLNLWKNIFLLIFGLTGFGFGTYVSLKQIFRHRH